MQWFKPIITVPDSWQALKDPPLKTGRFREKVRMKEDNISTFYFGKKLSIISGITEHTKII